MSNDARLDIACRYIPHDQWITTHIDPSWKIRVVKQWFLSKCTGSTFDAPPSQAPLHVHVTPLRHPRKKGHGSKKTPTDAGDSAGAGERPVSPITFAPDPRQRPISPILFAKAGTVGRERRRPREPVTDETKSTSGTATPTLSGGTGSVGDPEEVSEKEVDKEGYEEDNEWDPADEYEDEDEDDDDEDDDLGLPISPISMSPLGGAILPTSKKISATLGSPLNGKPDSTPPGIYTLIRFSTGQILEDEYLVSWYNLAPHELLELHSHVSKPLEERTSYPTRSKHTRNASIFSTTTTGGADPPNLYEKQYLPRLDRTVLSRYILPYFEGWVMALRVVWRGDTFSQTFYGGGTGFASAGFGSGAQFTESAYGLPVGEDSRRRGRRRGQREGDGGEMGGGHRTHGHGQVGRTTSLEWRSRWLVVSEGWVRLYRAREPIQGSEENPPTHEFPFSALITLRGKEHFERRTHLSQKPHSNTYQRSKPYHEHGNDMHSIHSNAASSRNHNHRSLSLNRSQSRSRSRAGHHHTEYESDSHSDSQTTGGVVKAGRERRRDRVHSGAGRVNHNDGPDLGEGEEERRIVCMKFQTRSKWELPKEEPPVVQEKRYASTQAGFSGGGWDGLGMGVTSFVTVGHSGAGKLKDKEKKKEKEKERERERERAKEKEEKKVKAKYKKERKLDKRGLEQALAHGAGGDGPYSQELSISGARESSRAFVGGGEWKDRARARTVGGQTKDKEKEKENERAMGIGMSLSLGLGLASWKGDKKPRASGLTASRSTVGTSESQGTSSTTRTPGTSISYTTPSSSYTRPKATSSGDDNDLDQEPMHEDGDVHEDSSGSEVLFARLNNGEGFYSDGENDYKAASKGPRLPAEVKVVSDEDDAEGSVPSDTETAPLHQPLHPHMDPTTDSEGSVALSDPVFAHSDEDCSDEDDVVACMDGFTAEDKRTHRFGYRYGYRYETVRDQGKQEMGAGETERGEENVGKVKDVTKIRKARPRQLEREQKEDKEKGEWVILDLGGDLAFSSFLRILHRHFPPPISSSFITGYPTFSTPTPMSTPTPTPTPTPFPSPTSPRSPVSVTPFVWPSSSENLLGNIGTRDPEPPSPLSTSSRGSRFRFEPPQHPAVLASLAVHAPLPVHKTFGALPYPEWRLEVAERAQKAGMGDVGSAMRWILWGCAEQLADDLAEVQNRNRGGDEANGGSSKEKGKMRSFTLKNRRQSTSSAIGAKPGSLYDSDASEDTGKILMNMSDSEGEGSEAEWHGWMADLHRQHQAQAQKEREAAEAALKPQSEEEDEDAPPKNRADDLRRYLEQRRALEPHGVVTTATPITASIQTTPSNTLYSPSSSESLAHRQRVRALSLSPVDISSSATTPYPSSSLSHQHTPSSSPPDNFADRKHILPPGATLSHSTSLYASDLRGTSVEPSRRPSMPILTAEQSFSLVGGSAIAPQASILRSPTATTFTFPASGSSISHSPPFSPAFSSGFNQHEMTTISSTVTTGAATMPRRASSAGLMNIGGVSGSLGRSSSVLVRSGGLLKKDALKEAERVREKEREKEKKAKDKEDRLREKEEKAKEKEKEKSKGKEKAKARPKLSLATPSSSATSNPTQSEQLAQHQVRSPTMDSIMRRVRSGSNLRQTDLEDKQQPTSPNQEGYGASSSKKKGALVHGVEKIVRHLDSALDFVDGKS
ncbi:hypothetical protein BDZ94DRAFT_1263415 [Collybia nuda]|uniref:PH domain-containing protein n=1 Tax=Collybia nuda TaxID=64659 RepID=A0A9P5Y3H5_9AGAR|nr:hypothetical protein BDZ94DRAFT_1263415 [Collybia nuda]